MKVPFINNVDKSFVNDIKTIISEAPGVFQSDKNRLIAWLEKQVEQKPQGKSILEAIKEEKVDNANKEFVDKGYEDGDWVVNNNGGSQFYQVITRSWPDSKIKGAEDNLELFINTATLDKQYHLWTIRDAKDGDVLVWDDSKCIALFKNVYDEDNFNSYGFIGHCTGKFEVSPNYHSIEGAHPASKEQRDLLFQKMEEKGYEWDAKKKELKKIEKKPANTVEPKFREGDSIQFKGFGHNRYPIKEVCGLSHYINTMGNRMDMSYTDANFEVIKDAEKRNEQKPYGQRQECIDCQFNYAGECKGYCAMKRGEHKPTDKVEPKFRVKYAGSEYNVLEVKEIAGIIFYGIEDEPHHIDYVRPDHCDIISGYGVKEKGNPYPTESAIFLEQNTAWNEADDAMRNFIALILRNHQSDEDFTTFETTFKDCIDWFKSLKERVQPQAKQEWSEEDMKMIELLVSIFEVNYSDGFYKVNPIGTTNMQGIHASEIIKWLKDVKERVQPQNMWISVDKEVYIKEPVLAQKKDKSDLFKGYVICCDHVLVPNVYERYIRLDNYCPQFTWKPSKEQIMALRWVLNHMVYDSHKEEINGLLKQILKLREE